MKLLALIEGGILLAVSPLQLLNDRNRNTIVWCDLGLKFLDIQFDPDSFSIFSHYPFPPGTVQSQ